VHTLGVSDEASDTHKRLRGRVKQALAGEFSVVWRGRGVAGCRREEFQGEGEVNLML